MSPKESSPASATEVASLISQQLVLMSQQLDTLHRALVHTALTPAAPAKLPSAADAAPVDGRGNAPSRDEEELDSPDQFAKLA